MARGVVTCLTIFLVICGYFNVNCEEDLVQITEDNWRQVLEDEWMLEFYAPWCPACSVLQKPWQEYATWGKDMGVKVGQVDVTKNPGLSGRFMITALPTVYHIHNGEFRHNKGSRDAQSLQQFIIEKKWEQIEPLAFWSKPDSPHMGLVAVFFKLSQFLRIIHNTMIEEYHVPIWGSYLLFALGTIVFGATLGLILVCVIDVLYPQRPESFESAPKYSKISSTQEKKKKYKESDDELADEFIKDDLIDDATDANSKSNTNSPRRRTARRDD